MRSVFPSRLTHRLGSAVLMLSMALISCKGSKTTHTETEHYSCAPREEQQATPPPHPIHWTPAALAQRDIFEAAVLDLVIRSQPALEATVNGAVAIGEFGLGMLKEAGVTVIGAADLIQSGAIYAPGLDMFTFMYTSARDSIRVDAPVAAIPGKDWAPKSAVVRGGMMLAQHGIIGAPVLMLGSFVDHLFVQTPQMLASGDAEQVGEGLTRAAINLYPLAHGLAGLKFAGAADIGIGGGGVGALAVSESSQWLARIFRLPKSGMTPAFAGAGQATGLAIPQVLVPVLEIDLLTGAQGLAGTGLLMCEASNSGGSVDAPQNGARAPVQSSTDIADELYGRPSGFGEGKVPAEPVFEDSNLGKMIDDLLGDKSFPTSPLASSPEAASQIFDLFGKKLQFKDGFARARITDYEDLAAFKELAKNIDYGIKSIELIADQNSMRLRIEVTSKFNIQKIEEYFSSTVGEPIAVESSGTRITITAKPSQFLELKSMLGQVPKSKATSKFAYYTESAGAFERFAQFFEAPELQSLLPEPLLDSLDFFKGSPTIHLSQTKIITHLKPGLPNPPNFVIGRLAESTEGSVLRFEIFFDRADDLSSLDVWSDDLSQVGVKIKSNRMKSTGETVWSADLNPAQSQTFLRWMQDNWFKNTVKAELTSSPAAYNQVMTQLMAHLGRANASSSVFEIMRPYLRLGEVDSSLVLGTVSEAEYAAIARGPLSGRFSSYAVSIDKNQATLVLKLKEPIPYHQVDAIEELARDTAVKYTRVFESPQGPTTKLQLSIDSKNSSGMWWFLKKYLLDSADETAMGGEISRGPL